jgi:hypothetical protein
MATGVPVLMMPLAMDVLMGMSRRLVAVLVAVMGMSRRLVGVLMLMLVLIMAAHISSLLSCLFYKILTRRSFLVKPLGFSGVISITV